jgi:hypothetical protein
MGPIGGFVGLLAGVALVLRTRGRFTAGGIAWRLPLVMAAVAGLAAEGFGIRDRMIWPDWGAMPASGIAPMPSLKEDAVGASARPHP